MNREQLFITLLKLALHPEDENIVRSFTDDADWPFILDKAERHSVMNTLHFAIAALPTDKCPDDIRDTVMRHMMHQLIVSENQLYEATRIFKALDHAGIDCMPFKGTVTKTRYPHTAMRSMGDIVILYDANKTKELRAVMESLEYTLNDEQRRHDHYGFPPYVDVEMHRGMVEGDQPFAPYFDGILQSARIKDGYRFVHEMSHEDELIHGFLHLVEHFRSAGVGVRFVMDIYVYIHLPDIDLSYVRKTLEKWDLLTFFDNICRLAEMWFGQDDTNDETIAELASYILNNGVYGSGKNKRDLVAGKTGGIRFLSTPFSLLTKK